MKRYQYHYQYRYRSSSMRPNLVSNKLTASTQPTAITSPRNSATHMEPASSELSDIELITLQESLFAAEAADSMPPIEEIRESIASLTSFGHARSQSISQFEEQNNNNASAVMRAELDKMVEQVPEGEFRKAFKKEMDGFYELFLRFIKNQESRLDWSRISSPSPAMIQPYASMTQPDEVTSTYQLSKLAVLKLNGGLGTTMGCVGPKSAIEVRDGMNFLDLTVRQVEWLNSKWKTNIPLILMNSFNTHGETRKMIQKYGSQRINVITFNQSRYPRISKDSLMPIPTSPSDAKEAWYPPGHGDIFSALDHSGLLDVLLSEGKEYLFISNIDNLGATVDPTILNHMVSSNAEFIMEVTDKTKADIKGGTIIDYDGQVRLLEIAQVPSEHKTDFTSVKKFKIFNTNNIWVSIKAIKRVLTEKTLDLDVIVNQKTLEGTGESVIQLETAVGAAIRYFRGSHGVNVPRSRFLPVKSCSDLFLLQSDLYILSHGELTINPKRIFPITPFVKLGDHFKKVSNFLSRFAGPPHIMELDHLTVTGDVYFGKNVTLKGTVIIVANHGNRIDIPSGAVLEDKVVSGNLRILDH